MNIFIYLFIHILGKISPDVNITSEIWPNVDFLDVYLPRDLSVFESKIYEFNLIF